MRRSSTRSSEHAPSKLATLKNAPAISAMRQTTYGGNAIPAASDMP